METSPQKRDFDILKSLARPPKSVITTFHAGFVLLGHPSNQAKKWDYAQKQMANFDRFINELKNFQAEKCTKEVANEAKELIADYDKQSVLNACAAATWMFDWVQNTVQQIQG
ncbi:uncharacterized protein LOC130050915 [Ostrea edulis]|uniref:uncharacterized protein LOC130050915 n=1 Tax=Ostrea edulis TaxID=37623 RepID=UPI0024AF5BF9|nr:uncharacterized protein LOC130050915 [Ostrea edulis]